MEGAAVRVESAAGGNVVSCSHENFFANVAVARISDSQVWYADLTLICDQCGEKMEFIGFPMGLSPGEPMVDVTGTELRIPFRPYSEEEAKRRIRSDDFKVTYRVGS